MSKNDLWSATAVTCSTVWAARGDAFGAFAFVVWMLFAIVLQALARAEAKERSAE